MHDVSKIGMMRMALRRGHMSNYKNPTHADSDAFG